MAFRLQFEDLQGNVLTQRSVSDGTLTIGRADSCDVILQSSSVSREHARFFVHHGRVYVEDLGSANGVVVNGAAIHGVTNLSEPTIVVIGDHVVRFEPDNAVARSAPASAPPSAWLIQLREVPVGQRSFGLAETRAAVGRTSTAPIRVPDASVSRLHAEIRLEPDATMIADMGSANGTFVNGAPVTTPTRLVHGDVVRFGDVAFAYTLDPALDWRTVREPAAEPVETGTPVLLIAATILAAAVIAGAVLVIALSARTPSPAERTLAANAAEAGNWAEAVQHFERAVAADSSDQTVVNGLQRARDELAAKQALDRCEADLASARSLQASAEIETAVASLDEVRTCLEGVAEGTDAAERAAQVRATDVLPALVELRRDAAARAVAAESWDSALEHLRASTRLARDLPAGPESARVSEQLRSAYIAAGNAALAKEEWARAASMLSQAEELGALDAANTARLTTARANAARQR